MHQVRPPAVAGAFYPGRSQTLSHDVLAMLAAAKPDAAGPPATPPKALIVPHAGYIYSGATAAQAYAQLAAVRQTIRRVVLLGPVHRVPVRGLALPGADFFATPLGEIEIDQDAVAAIRVAAPGGGEPGRPRAGAFAGGAIALFAVGAR